MKVSINNKIYTYQISTNLIINDGENDNIIRLDGYFVVHAITPYVVKYCIKHNVSEITYDLLSIIHKTRIRIDKLKKVLEVDDNILYLDIIKNKK